MEEKFLHAEEAGEERSSRYQTRKDLSSLSRAVSFASFDLSKLAGKSTFGRSEKLKSRKLIEQLFKEGKSVSKNGFTLVYLATPLQVMYPAQAGFSVPKRNFKHAVDRNRMKRLMREAYRANKLDLYAKLKEAEKQLAMMWVYKGRALATYEQTLEAVQFCLHKLKP